MQQEVLMLPCSLCIVKNIEETAHILHTLSHIEYNNREVKSCALTLD